jgi:hypothetical protein
LQNANDDFSARPSLRQVETIEEILAKRLLLHGAREIAMGRRKILHGKLAETS